MEQIVSVSTATYKESIRESTINLVFATPLLTESLITCSIAGDFDHDSDHQPILSKWTMRTVNNLLSLQLLVSKINIPTLKKTLAEELTKDLSCTSTTASKLDIKIYSLINVIDIAMTFAIPKARLSPKLVPRFDKECKKIQMKAKRLKKIWKKEETEESWEDFRITRVKKRRVIAKAKKNVLQVKEKSVCFPWEYVEDRKTCSKSDIKTTLPPKYSKIRRQLCYRAKKENRRTEKGFATSTTLSRPFRSCRLWVSK